MVYIIGIIIFLLILFLYLHIFFHIKTSDDLDIYDMIETPTKEKLEEICDLRQPVIFPFICDEITNCFSLKNLSNLYGVFDVKLRNVKFDIEDDEELYVQMSLNNSLKLIENDTDRQYLIENSNDFLEETSMKKILRSNDGFLRPYAVSNCHYDLNIASVGARSPFKYELNYRTYFCVLNGDVKIKLAPPKSSRYLYEIKDYDNFEFISPVNPWDIQDKYKTEFSKIKCLEALISKGQAIFIPAYWWHSIEFGENATVCIFKYRTYMNTIAILPKLLMRFLQAQNIKRVSFPKLDICI